MEEDRTRFAPRHSSLDDDVLPPDALFMRLATLANSQDRNRILIRDSHADIDATADRLLTDVLRLRRTVKRSLSDDTIHRLYAGEDVFIGVCALGGYEFAVSILAVLALGACATLISPLQPVEELAYYVRKTKSSAVVAATNAQKPAESLQQLIRATSDKNFVSIPTVAPVREGEEATARSSFTVSSDRQLDPNGPGIIIFTSGTTGPPKAVMLRRSNISIGAQNLAIQLGLAPTDILLHLLPCHHATGVNLSFFPFLQAGACIEFRGIGGFDPQWTWDRWRKGDLTHFSGVPTMYVRMMRHWQRHITALSPQSREEYRTGAARIRVMYCGTSALPKPVDDFWAGLRRGRRIVQRYGCTETQITITMPWEHNDHVPQGSVGKVATGVELKLSNEGEILAKSPHMFLGYLNDPETTKAAHDSDGFFKTGDMATKVGDFYFILGRASVDILKSGGYKISALDVEREILSLPYVNEVMVVGVPDDEFGQLVAAVVSLSHKTPESRSSLRIHDLRADLRSKLAGYKLPTLLLVVQGELPKNATGKVVKKTLGPTLFPKDYAKNPEIQVWRNQRDNRPNL